MSEDHIERAKGALRQEMRFLKETREQLAEAETDEEMLSAYRRVCAHFDGERPAETTASARVSLQAAFKERGLWDREHNRPDYDKISKGHADD